MLRLCINFSRNPNQQLVSSANRKLFLIRSLTSSSLTDSRGAGSASSSSSSLPLSAGPSAFGLSLDSLEAYASKLAERNKSQKRAPIKRRSTKRAAQESAEEPKTFDSLGLSSLVLSQIHTLKLDTPTDVQHTAIPVLLGGDDAAIQSYTGSGKTLAYLLPILSVVGPLRESTDNDGEVSASKRGIEAIIVAPSRELAMQIVREAERILGAENKKIVQQLVGGANRSRQEEALRKNKPLIVVGTPGRISEISRDGKLHTHSCRFLVLDEADELLSIQFREDMRRILEHVGKRKSLQKKLGSQINEASNADEDIHSLNDQIGKNGSKVSSSNSRERKEVQRVERQTVLVSATMPMSVLRAAADWGQKPLLVKGKMVMDVEDAPPSHVLSEQSASQDMRGVKESMPPSLQHFFAISPLQHRVDTARKCIHAVGAKSVIVFMNHPRRLKDTVFKFEARGITAAELHGELGKLERTNTLAAFKNGKIRVLVTSEVGARGIDVPECDLVVNLELPTDMTHYAHRAGRTGRLGRKGTVLSICEQTEAFVIRKFERQLSVVIEECEFVKGGLVSSKDSATNPTPQLV
ncbi:hypothetical protein GOP47_0019498 [Adiantum capillus-veneris]|uniref:RNA helicase n=1 Tax=Adiantum capillus-veneris TaxID=13818 RepID=A0A9D4UC49_ADICA|nr:hypothetical protein GOP47_0019498 [Adiantum capillus-veneris]